MPLSGAPRPPIGFLMNYVKLATGLFASVFFFAFGIWFQAGLPQAQEQNHDVREPASIARANASTAEGKGGDLRATNAFKGCVNAKAKDSKSDSVNIGKTTVEGRRWSIVSIPCTGDSAKELYEAIQPYSTEEYVRYRDKRRGVVRFFGRLFPPSQCVELIGSQKGKAVNDYSCSIRIDVDSEITEQLKL